MFIQKLKQNEVGPFKYFIERPTSRRWQMARR